MVSHTCQISATRCQKIDDFLLLTRDSMHLSNWTRGKGGKSYIEVNPSERVQRVVFQDTPERFLKERLPTCAEYLLRPLPLASGLPLTSTPQFPMHPTSALPHIPRSDAGRPQGL